MPKFCKLGRGMMALSYAKCKWWVCAAVGHQTTDRLALNCEHQPIRGLLLRWQRPAPVALLSGGNSLYCSCWQTVCQIRGLHVAQVSLFFSAQSLGHVQLSADISASIL